MPSKFLSNSVDYNNSTFLLIVSDFIIGRLCLRADLKLHVDKLVFSLRFIGQIHISSTMVGGGIGLKNTKGVQFLTLGLGFQN